MREVITPGMLRVQQQSAEQFERALEEQARLKAEKKARVEAMIVEAFAGIDEETQRTIRMHVALRAPQKPMSAEELQIWLDEHCIGVAKYMTTGKIV